MAAILDSIIDKGLGHVGNVWEPALDEARVFPRSWQVTLQFAERGYKAQLAIVVKRGSGKKERKLKPFGERFTVEWGEGATLDILQHPLAVHLPYLLDAVDFVGTPTIHVYNRGELDPVILLPYRSGASTAPEQAIESAERFAIVMPIRV